MMTLWDDCYELDTLTGARLHVEKGGAERSARLVAEGEALPQTATPPRRPLNHQGAPRERGPLRPTLPEEEEWPAGRTVAAAAGVGAAGVLAYAGGMLWAHLGFDPAVGLALASLGVWGTVLFVWKKRGG